MTDDLGTGYLAISSGGGGGGDERIGRTRFYPAIPSATTRLVLHWGELEFPVNVTS